MFDLPADMYAQLPLAAEVRPLDATTSARLSRITPMLQADGQVNVLAVGLAHRHFNVQDKSVAAWVRRGGSLELRAVDPTLIKVVPVAWAASAESIWAIEYASADIMPAGLIPVLQANQFIELREGLLSRLQHGLTRPQYVVSVAPAVYYEFFFPGRPDIGLQQTFLETEDEAGTSTRVVPYAAAGMFSAAAVPTLWGVRQDRIKVVQACRCKQ
jgi:hypothetical protein